MNTVTIPNNEIFQAGAQLVIDGEPIGEMTDIVTGSIVQELYEHGVKSATSQDFITDTKKENGAKAYDWSKGEFPPIGTVCLVMKDRHNPISKNRYEEPVIWRIMGNNIKYDGQPLIDREYIEIITRR